MAAILQKLENAIAAGLVLVVALLLIFGVANGFRVDGTWFFDFLFRWAHTWFGILWIGLLYYFNFVQIPSMPKIPDDQKPAVSKVIAPAALYYFRWAALLTVLTGLVVAFGKGYFVNAMTLGLVKTGVTGATVIGVGMWLGLIMAYNVWFIIWPNQQKALGLVDCPADQKPKAARMAMLTSRFNFMLSFPMLFCMTAQAHGGL